MAATMHEPPTVTRTPATPPHDNSALRARLDGRPIEHTSVESELRALIADRADGVVSVREGRWR